MSAHTAARREHRSRQKSCSARTPRRRARAFCARAFCASARYAGAALPPLELGALPAACRPWETRQLVRVQRLAVHVLQITVGERRDTGRVQPLRQEVCHARGQSATSTKGSGVHGPVRRRVRRVSAALLVATLVGAQEGGPRAFTPQLTCWLAPQLSETRAKLGLLKKGAHGSVCDAPSFCIADAPPPPTSCACPTVRRLGAGQLMAATGQHMPALAPVARLPVGVAPAAARALLRRPLSLTAPAQGAARRGACAVVPRRRSRGDGVQQLASSRWPPKHAPVRVPPTSLRRRRAAAATCAAASSSSPLGADLTTSLRGVRRACRLTCAVVLTSEPLS